jgi:hypothetical protein
MKKTVAVLTNAPDSPAPLHLTIQGEIWEPVAYDPRTVSFGQITNEAARESTPSRTITIVSNLEEPVELSDVHSTNPVFQVQTSIVEPGRKYEVAVSAAGPLRPGNNSGLIEISTSAADTPTLRIPVVALLKPDVDVSPPRLTLPQLIAAEVNQRFNIRNATQTPLTITDVSASHAAFQVELREHQPGKLYSLELVVPAGTELSPTGEKITFKTSLPGAAEMAIPIHVKRLPATQPSTPVRSAAPATRPGS